MLLILDEAYYEFVEDPAYAGSHELALQSTNVVSSRTFSKVHGIAGFGIAPLGISDYAWRAHVPFSVSILAQAAAEASMGQTRSIIERARFMTQERERLQAAFDETGLEYVPSHTNFILVRTGPAVFERTGVLVREGEALGYPGWSRISIGSAQENDRIMAALTSPVSPGLQRFSLRTSFTTLGHPLTAHRLPVEPPETCSPMPWLAERLRLQPTTLGCDP
ncbi:Biosynthetic Aromatic amino acid aminotransferase beta [uncultured Rubrobacteraceae bacterium]|uniref:histidinol-phosphate transaminase n=1 Tax=uncultured Rubrobacteraceae bacterium TaxID=349277 RepID=A0A6J4Q3S7_9ACTN|nr:Biosynthetic Aromatic amino acid aminotransferase beta [uncultured Rubrobacteraceae bacterium]